MKKKLLTLAVALLAATGAWAQTTFTVNNLKYTVTDETTHTVELTDYVTKPTGTLTIPATVTNEGTEYSVTSIGTSAFAYCSSLTEVNIPASAINIGSWVFDYCSALTAIHVAEDNTAYSSEDGVLFNKDKTTLVCYPIGKTETTYTVPATVTTFTRSAFEGCTALAQINLPNSLTYMGVRTFYGCTSLTEVTLPDGLTRIGLYTFTGCSALEKVTLPEGITYIDNGAFANCSALEKVTLPEGITYIRDEAFYNCTALTEMTVLATTPPTLGTDVFLNVSRTIPVYVPATSLATYQAAAVWNEFNLQAIGTTGLQTPAMPESIRMQGGMLHNPQGLTVTIYDLTGRPVYCGNDLTVSRQAGIYVVLCEGASLKVKF